MKLVPVLIAGGGPVGMTLACELSRRRIECMLVERNATTTRYPKMDITNARSMELFRRSRSACALDPRPTQRARRDQQARCWLQVAEGQLGRHHHAAWPLDAHGARRSRRVRA